MQSSSKDTTTVNGTVVRRGFAAQPVDDAMDWGEGAIQPLPGRETKEDAAALMNAVLDSITKVDASEAVYSSCTDGRLPVRLLNGEAVPVREQMVGADIVSAFFVAEALGERFYADVHAPLAARITDVAAFLRENGLQPSSHIACGAAAGFTAICQNMLRFGRDERYLARVKALMPTDSFSDELQRSLLAGVKQRLDSGTYEGLAPDMFLGAAKEAGGDRAVAELRDDDRGVHGHVEEAIVRVQLPGWAVSGAALADATEGRQVFAVNDTRMERLARLFSRGSDQDYRLARLALENFADSGHGTLAKHLPTYRITAD